MTIKRIHLLALIALFVVACGSMGSLGDLAGILGSTGTSDPSDVRGVVSSVDTNARRIDLNVNYVNNLRQDGGGSSIYYDQNTVVEFNGRTYSPSNLERGDEISVVGTNQGGQFIATRITVLQDVSR